MTTSQSFEEGPYLSAAIVCEKVLEERNGVKSVIRIIDRVTHQAVGPNPPQEMVPFDYEMAMLIRFKSGRARGTYPLEIQLIKPSGESAPPMRRNILFEGEDDRGLDIVVNMKLKFDQIGIYWFNIDLNNVNITRLPFRVVYLPQIR
ncbi:MAG TPA: hypothetical protein G4N93_03075 [Dehalococcoidia bacterium]|nr:hypothetical protein [Dehalococcoidia bacterium]